jgi:hypothetical protein
MRLFSKRSAAQAFSGDPLQIFWTWWQNTGANSAAQALHNNQLALVASQLDQHTHAIHPDLVWELAPGIRAKNQLVLTPDGQDELRALARRWLRLAPVADQEWEYGDARPPVPDLSEIALTTGHETINFGDLTAHVVHNGVGLEVEIYHPAFAMLGRKAPEHICELALDTAIGEYAVQTWVKRSRATVRRPIDPVPLTDLTQYVADLERRRLDQHGHPEWMTMRGFGPRGPVSLSVIVPLSVTQAPDYTEHLTVSAEFADATDEGLPGPVALEELRVLEVQLCDSLLGLGRLVAHESCAGVRTLNFYLDASANGIGIAQSASTIYTQGVVTIEQTHDPGWRNVQRLRP